MSALPAVLAAATQGVPAGLALLFSVLALFWLVHIPFISEPRYRIPIAPLLQVLEAAGLVLLGDALREALRSLPLRWGWSRAGR